MSDSLQDYVNELIPAGELEMQAVLSFTEDGGDDLFLGMLHYHMGWVNEEMQPVEANGGKRIRPLLCLLACEAAGGEWRRALPAGAAIELLHNFTLIHDDIQDASPTRRGRRTVWKLWGVPQAINAGDCLFSLSHLALYNLTDQAVDAGTILRAAQRFDDTCLHLTYGQHHDMNFETRQAVSVDEYIAMIGGKTAALIALCGELGALVAGADAGTVDHYASFGRDLGLAFQVKDDILGIWGDEEAIGKSAATDIATRKKTLPVLYGLEQHEELRQLYTRPGNGPDFVPRVVQLLDEVGAREYAEARAAHYSEGALDHLEAAAPTGPAGDALRQLADILLDREA